MGPNLTVFSARNERPARRQQRRRSGACLAALAGLALLSGCSSQTADQWSRVGLPEGASTSATAMMPLWIGAWVASAVVGVLVWGLIIWSAVRYRRRHDDEIPTQVRYNLPIEVLYTVAPFVVIFVFFYHTVVAQEAMLPDDDGSQEEVLVVGQQWSWAFNYLGEDGLDTEGATGGNDVYTVGTPADEPTLVLPVDTEVKFILRSPDVIHSFWIPAFYFKMDVVPGRTNTWITTPTKEGTYAGKCAELCGLQHSRMLFTVKVVSQSEYEQELQTLRDQGNTGHVLGSTDTDAIVGEETAQNGAGE